MIEFLAKTDLESARWFGLAFFCARFLLVSLALYLATHALRSIPLLTGVLQNRYARLVVYLLVLGAAGFLAFWLIPLRVLQSLALLPDPQSLVWVDVVFSALVLAQLSMMWPAFMEWFNKRRAG